jgi:hypothetical protein
MIDAPLPSFLRISLLPFTRLKHAYVGGLSRARLFRFPLFEVEDRRDLLRLLSTVRPASGRTQNTDRGHKAKEGPPAPPWCAVEVGVVFRDVAWLLFLIYMGFMVSTYGTNSAIS